MPTAAETEGWLEGHEVSWRRRDVPLEEIDWKASQANQARLDPVDPTVVDRYAAAIDAGEVLPPIVVHSHPHRGHEQLVILGGNHRYAAHLQAGVPSIDAYIVDCPAKVATVLMYEDNARHGLAPSDQERIAQALHLVATTRMPLKRAAAIVGVSTGKVQIAKQTAEVDARARELGLGRLDALSQSVRFRLAAVAEDDVFEALGDLVLDAGLSSAQLNRIVPHLNRLATVEEKLDHIAEERSVWRTRVKDLESGRARPGRGRRTERLRFHSAVSELMSLTARGVVDDATAEQLDDVARKALQLARHLHTIGTAAKHGTRRPDLQVVG